MEGVEFVSKERATYSVIQGGAGNVGVAVLEGIAKRSFRLLHNYPFLDADNVPWLNTNHVTHGKL
eukprot:4369150-Amphidinium_carterae.1